MKQTVIPSTGPLSVTCPLCGSKPGEKCITKAPHTVYGTMSHHVRIRLANGLKRSSA